MRNTDREICKIFSKNLKYYMNLTGTSRNDICKDLHIKYSTLSNWLSCYSYASEDNIKQLTDYFEISSDWNGQPKELASGGTVTYTVTVMLKNTPTSSLHATFHIELTAVSDENNNP